MNRTGQAVFLSYASQDAEAAKRICEALRAAGVEVWLDQEGGLVGGDAWDRKIREQIAACALFVPLISTNTQARKEGYFRLEWKLATQRTHMMSERTAFLLPVVIDATRDADADVPAEFRAVQWTRLPGGETSATFCKRVKNLLGMGAEMEVQRPRSVQRGEDVESPVQPVGRALRARRAWIFGAVVAAIFLGAFGWKQLSRNSAAANDRSLAVLPFANLSTEKENEFFADGMHDELLTALAKVGALKVISRTSVLAYRDPAKRNLKQIAAELGVAHVLEGSVSRAGNRVRIIVQLIDAATDQHRWAETYNKDVTDVFQVQADISAQIAKSLAATLSPELKLALAKKLTDNPAAYDLYLQARRWRELGRGQLRTTAKFEEVAVAPLERAVALDSNFAAAYAELSEVHSYLYWWPDRDPTPARLAKAKAAVDTAMRLDSALPAVHSALGYYHYVGSLDYARATEEYTLALAAIPGDANVLLNLAAAQRRRGRWAEATVNLERAFAINPRHLDLAVTWVDCLAQQRYYARAERAAERALAATPGNDVLLGRMARARFARDGNRVRYWSALDAIPREPDAEPPDPRIRQFQDVLEDGRFAEAVRIFEDPVELVAQDQRATNLNFLRYLSAARASGQSEKASLRALAMIADTETKTTEHHREEWSRAVRLALLRAYTAQPDEARRLADRALELMPVQRDAVVGPSALAEVAQVHLALGDRDRALALLDQALSVPSYLIANELRLEPWWAPLRDDPRFKAALAKAASRD